MRPPAWLDAQRLGLEVSPVPFRGHSVAYWQRVMDGLVQEPVKSADLYRKLAAEHFDLVKDASSPSFAGIISASRGGIFCTRKMRSIGYIRLAPPVRMSRRAERRRHSTITGYPQSNTKPLLLRRRPRRQTEMCDHRPPTRPCWPVTSAKPACCWVGRRSSK